MTIKIINTTPHAISFIDSEGNFHSFPSNPGNVVTAKAVETEVGCHGRSSGCSGCPHFFHGEDGAQFPVCASQDKVTLVKVAFSASPEAEAILARLEAENPGAVIVGSIIAAQAFPGRVLAMVPAVGFERVPPDQKRMRMDRFTTF